MSNSTVLPNFRSGIVLSFFAVMLAVAGTPLASAQDAADEEIENIVVTGTYIQRAQSDLPSPIDIISSAELAEINATSVSDLVNTLTINTGAQIYSNNLDQGRDAGVTNINLRGLGEESTLVLLNGTRTALTPAVNGRGSQYVNLSTLIPMIAVERVEILKDGASALYGSDAVAGVVNFITRDTFEGLEIKLEVGYNEYGADQTDVGIILGGRHDRGNFMAAFEYLKIDPVTSAERNDPYNAKRNSITGFGMPSSIVSFGEDVIMPDPQCNNVADMFDPGLVFEAFLCRLTFGQYGHIVADEERMQGFFSGTYEFTDNAEFFAEASFANNEVIIGSVPTQPVTDPVYVPENHPDVAIFAAGPSACCGIDPLDPYANVNRTNPDNGGLREVQWWGRILGAGSPQNNDLKPFEKWSTRGGLRGAINEVWDYTLGYSYSIEETSAFRRESVKKELQNALYGRGGPDRNEFYRFAWDTRDQNSQGLMDTIIGFYGYEAQSTQKVFDGIVSGEFGSIGGGAIGAAFGVQWREDTLKYDYNNPSEAFVFTFFVGGADFDASQSATAVFGEVALPFTENFELNIAARWEEIESESTVDPKISLLFTPTDQWSIRGSYGTSFRVPSLFTSGGQNYNAGAGTDPVSGQPITYRARFATDPSTPVVPQEADTWNVGATYAGENGLTASFDYWSFDYEGFIVYESQGAVLATDPTGPQVLRDSSGNVIEVTGFASNAGFLKTSGIDFNISYAIDTGSGTFTPFLDSTYMLEYEIDDPQWGPIDALGWANTHNVGSAAIEARANVGLRWENDKHSANIYARYIDSFLSDESSARLGGPITTTDSGGNTVLDPANFLPVESHTTIDAQYAYRSDSLFGSDTESTIRLGVRNALDEDAPLVWSTAGYEENVHDPRGRYIFLSLTTAF